MTAMPKPLVIVIENPEADPDVIVVGDVEVIELSTYPVSKWCPWEERLDYAETYPWAWLAAADQLPADHPTRKDLRRTAHDFRIKLAEDEMDHPAPGDIEVT